MPPPKLVINTITTVHTTIYRATGGRIGKTVPGALPTLLLDHVGAKSGTKRTTPLSYLAHDDAMVIVASFGGAPHHPAWFHNLKAHPGTEVQVGGQRFPVRARVADDEEREHLWPKVVAGYKGYASYQRKTTRTIPLVILERR